MRRNGGRQAYLESFTGRSGLVPIGEHVLYVGAESRLDDDFLTLVDLFGHWKQTIYFGFLNGVVLPECCVQQQRDQEQRCLHSGSICHDKDGVGSRRAIEYVEA